MSDSRKPSAVDQKDPAHKYIDECIACIRKLREYDRREEHRYAHFMSEITLIKPLPEGEDVVYIPVDEEGVSLLTLVFLDKKFAVAQKVELLNQLFEANPRQVEAVFRNGEYVKEMCSNPEWAHFVVEHLHLLMFPESVARTPYSQLPIMTQYFLTNAERLDIGNPQELFEIMRTRIDSDSQKISLENYLGFVKKLIYRQDTTENIVKTYQGAQNALRGYAGVTQEILSNIEKMAKNRLLWLEYGAKSFSGAHVSPQEQKKLPDDNKKIVNEVLGHRRNRTSLFSPRSAAIQKNIEAGLLQEAEQKIKQQEERQDESLQKELNKIRPK